MSTTPSLEQALCSQFCAYYKPGKNEELACQGYVVVERLLQAGMVIAFKRTGSGPDPDQATIEALVRHLCMFCDFHEQDCDFMQDRTASACGGFVLLAQLLASNALSINEIKL